MEKSNSLRLWLQNNGKGKHRRVVFVRHSHVEHGSFVPWAWRTNMHEALSLRDLSNPGTLRLPGFTHPLFTTVSSSVVVFIV